MFTWEEWEVIFRVLATIFFLCFICFLWKKEKRIAWTFFLFSVATVGFYFIVWKWLWSLAWDILNVYDEDSVWKDLFRLVIFGFWLAFWWHIGMGNVWGAWKYLGAAIAVFAFYFIVWEWLWSWGNWSLRHGNRLFEKLFGALLFALFWTWVLLRR